MAKGHVMVDLMEVRRNAQDVTMTLLSMDKTCRAVGTIQLHITGQTLTNLRYFLQRFAADTCHVSTEFVYDKYLPVLDAYVPIPPLAQPSVAWTLQDKQMKEGMANIAVYWKTRGAANALSIVPQR